MSSVRWLPKSSAILLAGLLLGAPALAHAATWVVDADGLASATDCNAATPALTQIGAAIKLATNGDEVLVCQGHTWRTSISAARTSPCAASAVRR